MDGGESEDRRVCPCYLCGRGKVLGGIFLAFFLTRPRMIRHNTKCIPLLSLYLRKLSVNITSCFARFNNKGVRSALFALFLSSNSQEFPSYPTKTVDLSFNPWKTLLASLVAVRCLKSQQCQKPCANSRGAWLRQSFHTVLTNATS